jgi:plasmid stabilization system protein ParE
VSLRLVFKPAARQEYRDAADWYESRSPGRGKAFRAAVRYQLDRITANPRIHGKVYQDVRKAVVRGYPYNVYYSEEPGRVVVLSVFHTSRDPRNWQSRV